MLRITTNESADYFEYPFIVEELQENHGLRKVFLIGFDKHYIVPFDMIGDALKKYLRNILKKEINNLLINNLELHDADYIDEYYIKNKVPDGYVKYMISTSLVVPIDGYLITNPPNRNASNSLMQHLVERIKKFMLYNHDVDVKLFFTVDNPDKIRNKNMGRIVNFLEKSINKDYHEDNVIFLSYLTSHMPIIDPSTNPSNRINALYYYEEFKVVIAIGPFFINTKVPHILVFAPEESDVELFNLHRALNGYK